MACGVACGVAWRAAWRAAWRLARGPRDQRPEVFGRPNNTREGWLTIGNQLPGVQLVEPDLVERFNAHYPALRTTVAVQPLPRAPVDLAVLRIN